LPLARARWIVSTLPKAGISLALLQSLRRHGYRGRVALAAHDERDAAALRRAGADRVLMPFSDAADLAARELAEEVAQEVMTSATG
jgi:Trk K+ transport system NAD-binding subunit